MARSSKTKNKGAEVLAMPNPEPQISDPLAAEPPQTPFDEPAALNTPPPPAPAAPASAKAPRAKRTQTFFERINALDAADWGTRYFMYLYCLEPICNLKLTGENKFLNKFQAPIEDEQPIMVDYGSGKYRLVLVNRKPAATDVSGQIDQFEFEIYNPNHPPKIPKRVWMNDPRNERWEALLPPDPPPPPPPGQNPSTMDSFGTFLDIQDRIEQRIAPKGQTAAPAEQAAKAPTTDPWEAAERIMNMRSQNPMVDMLRDELKEMRTEAREARKEAAERVEKLQAELRAAQNAPAQQGKGLVEQLTELAGVADKLGPLKSLLGFPAQAAAPVQETVRTARTTGLDLVRDLITSPTGEHIGRGLGTLLTTFAQQQINPAAPGAPASVPPPAQQASATAPTTENERERIIRIAQTVTGPMLHQYFEPGEDGDVFASAMFDMWPDDYMFVRALGPDRLLALYKEFPPAWTRIAPREAAFLKFLQEMCAWKPDEEAPNSQDDGIIDAEVEQEPQTV